MDRVGSGSDEFEVLGLASSLPGIRQVGSGFGGFLPGFTGFYRVFGHHPVSIGFLPSFLGFDWV